MAELCSYRDQRRDVAIALDSVAAFFLLGHEREEHVAVLLADQRALAGTTGPGGLGIEQTCRHAKLHGMRPVREVEERVEALPSGCLVALEVARGVVVDEARRRDARSSRVRASSAISFGVSGRSSLELVVPVLAHGASPRGRSRAPSAQARRLASLRASFFARCARACSSTDITTCGRSLPNLLR
jgi:hypothetical protein